MLVTILIFMSAVLCTLRLAELSPVAWSVACAPLGVALALVALRGILIARARRLY